MAHKQLMFQAAAPERVLRGASLPKHDGPSAQASALEA
jgi:hypothetical protein